MRVNKSSDGGDLARQTDVLSESFFDNSPTWLRGWDQERREWMTCVVPFYGGTFFFFTGNRRFYFYSFGWCYWWILCWKIYYGRLVFFFKWSGIIVRVMVGGLEKNGFGKKYFCSLRFVWFYRTVSAVLDKAFIWSRMKATDTGYLVCWTKSVNQI